MSIEKQENPMLIWHDCDEGCGFTDIINGECECYNREMDRREKQSKIICSSGESNGHH